MLNLLDEQQSVEEEWFIKAAQLNDFAVKIRYPSGIEPITLEKLSEAISNAESFQSMVLSIVKDLNNQ